MVLFREVTVTETFTTHSVWSILPWQVPWDVGHVFFLGLTYMVLAVLGGTLAMVVLRTRRSLKNLSQQALKTSK